MLPMLFKNHLSLLISTWPTEESFLLIFTFLVFSFQVLYIHSARQMQRNRETQSERERQRISETERQQNSETERQRNKETERERRRDRETERQRDRKRQRQIQGQTDGRKLLLWWSWRCQGILVPCTGFGGAQGMVPTYLCVVFN